MSMLVVNVGGMFSGKTTELQRQGERHLRAGQRVIFVKPALDTRFSKSEVVNHNGYRVRAIRIDTGKHLDEYINPEEVDVVCIDEAQFFDKKLINSVWWLLSKGIKVYASGLDMDFMGEGFPTTMELMARADEVQKFHAVCECCGADATFTGKRTTSENKIELGAKETYIPLCRSCYENFI